MTAHPPILMVVLPLGVACVLPLVAFYSVVLVQVTVLGTLLAVSLCAGLALHQVLQSGPWHYALGGWVPPWGIEYVIDPLSGGMATLIAGMAVLVALYAGPYQRHRSVTRVGIFYSLFLLLTAGLLGMVLTGDAFNLYVFLEISSLAAYALLASDGIRAVLATFRYLLVGTIAGTFYLLGVGYLYALTGTLNMADLTARLPAVLDSSAYGVAVAFITVGLAIKTALFPLHGWLPDTYTYAPAPVIGFIAAVMAKVSAYALLRVLYFVFRADGAAGQALVILGWTSAVAVVAGSVLALAQRDIRRMLAYSSIGQMGYITLGVSLGTPDALTGALLHVLTHAVMKGCLFLIAGGVHWHLGVSQIAAFAGMSRRLPFTMAGFVVAALSMVGLPPTAGFFSKWYLISGAIAAHAWVFVGALLLSSLLTAVYFFRVIELSYFGQPDATDTVPHPAARWHDLPAPMLTPIVLLAAGVLLLGLLQHSVVTHLIRYALPPQGL
jgi:multicomponent Na+:H+ antiporter subunit D